MKRVYLESPYKGIDWASTPDNLRFARLCTRDCFKRGEAAFASHLLYPQRGILRDRVPAEREMRIEAGFDWKVVAELTVVYINRGVSMEMHYGIRRSVGLGQEIEYRMLPVYARLFPNPLICTISGASGAGKATIIKRLLEVNSSASLITSYTTRGARDSDLPGEYYYNVPPETFEKRRDEFLWVVSVGGNLYGTTRGSVLEQINSGSVKTPVSLRFMVLVPDAVRILRERFKAYADRIVSFYIPTPGADVLLRRLIERGDGSSSAGERVAECMLWDEGVLKSDIPYIFVPNNGHITGIDKIVSQMSLFL